MPELSYSASPTVAKFMRSQAFGRLILGPIGSGKTTSCIMDLLAKAAGQAPAPNGLAYTRFVIVRSTLKQLKETVLKDVQALFSTKGMGEWKVSESTFYLNFEHIRSEWVFLPLDDQREAARLLSLQATGAMMSEFTEMNIDTITHLSGRLGRYPNGLDVGFCTWSGIIGDSNMPMEGTPWHKFLENLPADWSKWVQPSGLAPDAENLDHLLQTDNTRKLPLGNAVRRERGRLYYQRLVDQHGLDSDWVKRYVQAQYGNDPTGESVFRATWKSAVHTRPDTQLFQGYPLLIGQDFGRNPWSIICQVSPFGQLIVHEEVAAENVGLEKHLTESLKPILLNKYLGFRHAIIGDPAGIGKDSHSEENSFELMARLGFSAYPAPTNNLDPRIRSVEALLGKYTTGGVGLIVNSEKCPRLVQAMSGGYRYVRVKGGDGALKAVPDKQDREGYSHVADTLQYIALVVHGNLIPSMTNYLWPAPRAPKERITPRAWT